MRFFTVTTVLLASTKMVASSPSSRLRMLNQRRLQGEGCKLLRRAMSPVLRIATGALQGLPAKLGNVSRIISKRRLDDEACAT
ncbi:hypothetical protein OPQ81_011312 [Rhizoctonia solani]|nr:hypothetical protein OPQ81_011312 [Rhizoctonia solani]